MNKGELVDQIAADAKITKKQAESALDSFINATTHSLKKGDKLSLIGFGTFEVRERSAREGVNPATGDKLKIPAKKVVKFKPGKKLSDTVN